MRAATEGRAVPPSTPLRSAPGAALGLARTRQKVPPQTERLSNDGTPKVHALAGYPPPWSGVGRVAEACGSASPR